jgi:hypothetical protein
VDRWPGPSVRSSCPVGTGSLGREATLQGVRVELQDDDALRRTPHRVDDDNPEPDGLAMSTYAIVTVLPPPTSSGNKIARASAVTIQLVIQAMLESHT